MDVKRGFKQTEIGFIPVDWEITQLQNLATDIGDGIHTTPIYTDNSEYYFINGNNLNNGKIQINENTKCVARNEYNKNFVKLGKKSILLSINGTIGNLAYFNNEKVILGKSAAYINLIDELNKEYFFYVLDSNSIKNYFKNELTGTTIRNLSLLSLRNTPIPLPSLAEQHAIAEALSDVDAFIAAQEALIAKKRAIKQGVMQELLTGKRRLPGFSGEWEEKRLEEIAIIFKGSGLSKSALITTGKNNCILYGELFTTYDRVIKKVKSRTNQIFGVLSKSGDVLMPGSTTTVGLDLAIASALLVDNVLLGGDINVIRAKNDFSFSPIYLAYYLSNINREKISEITQGITIIHLYGKSLLKLLLRLPSFEEQEEIAQNLFEIDNEIKALEIKRDKTIFIKQAMMQELLTGRIRLTGV